MSEAERRTSHEEMQSPQAAASANPPLAGRAGATLTVDLGAIVENYAILCRMLGGVSCAAVVKADAYGLGAARVVPALEAAGCRTFFVAHLEEAIALRPLLERRSRIVILNGLPFGAECEAVELGILPVLNGVEQVEAWHREAVRRQRPLAAILQVDSGMSRLGLASGEIDRVVQSESLDGIELALVMSHLACADEPEHPANERQRLVFESLRKRLPAAPATLANSSGIFLGRSYHLDLARPGAALYGLNPAPQRVNPMRPVVALTASVIQVRDVPAGVGIGYGHAFTATTPMRLATLSIGYADGLHRAASGASAVFGGVRLPVVGRVSMDSVVVDASALPSGGLEAGMSVELIGPSQSVDDLARLIGTIGYEVLTSFGSRFERRYKPFAGQ